LLEQAISLFQKPFEIGFATLKVYAHVIPQSQRESMERIANRSIGTKLANGTRAIA
jgi:hypothetical protein